MLVPLLMGPGFCAYAQSAVSGIVQVYPGPRGLVEGRDARMVTYLKVLNMGRTLSSHRANRKLESIEQVTERGIDDVVMEGEAACSVGRVEEVFCKLVDASEGCESRVHACDGRIAGTASRL